MKPDRTPEARVDALTTEEANEALRQIVESADHYGPECVPKWLASVLGRWSLIDSRAWGLDEPKAYLD